MTVGELRARMSNLEWIQWAAYLRLNQTEAQRAREKAERQAKNKQVARSRRR